jgi:hypothetical protein
MVVQLYLVSTKATSTMSFNPLIDDLSSFSDKEIEDKIFELNKKYWMTQNPQVRDQITTVLETYKIEAETRRAKERSKMNEKGDSPLDNLINIS